MRVDPLVYVPRSGRTLLPRSGTMGAILAWFTAIVLLLSLVLMLHHLGVEVGPLVSSALHGVEHALGQPL